MRVYLAWLVLAACAAGCGQSTASPTTPGPIIAPPTTQGCGRTSVGLTPLTDLGTGTYQGQAGGLYPAGSNSAPGSHLSAGMSLASSIGPLDRDGLPDPAGRYALLSVGMSNTTQEFQAFMPLAAADGSRDSRLVIVDGAQGGQTAADWANPGCACWTTLDSRLQQAGVTRAQVAVAWVKLANRQPTGDWPAATSQLKADTVRVMQALATRLPNLRLAYLSSRIYAGYATTTLNPEPYAYQGGFAVRWVIEDQLNGLLPFTGASRTAPWMAWGPYLWADGLTPRGDGLTWACGEFADDGTHPGTTGRQKVAQLLLRFFQTDPTAREWFTGSADRVRAP
jgi:hypothetical protein